MDDLRFDQWTRSFDAVASRRGTVKVVAGGLLGTLVAHFGGEEAAAKCVNPGKRCDRRDPKLDTCCGGATCRRKRCRCPKDETPCGKSCCATGEICAGGRCVIGQAACPDGTDSCRGTPVICADNPTCLCVQRVEGGTRCAQASEDFACEPCTSDGECRVKGFPPGTSCVIANGPNCGCFGFGACATPCGIASPPRD